MFETSTGEFSAVETLDFRSRTHTQMASFHALASIDSLICRPALLSHLLAKIQTELDRVRNIARKAGYTVVFRAADGTAVEQPPAGLPRARQKPPAPAQGGLTPGALRRVQEHIEQNLAAKVELADLAAVAKLSRCHFAYAFKQSIGITAHHYVMCRRLAKASGLLSMTELPIVDIALTTGFADQSHFSRCFRSFFGVSPRAFRRAHH